jgi:polyisoprenoid-binding protein YceI
MRYLVLAALFGLAAPASAADWIIEAPKSSISFSGTHAGKNFQGRFAKWTGQIRFDPAKLAQAKAVILIDLASANTGDKTYDGTLPQADWLAVNVARLARFETTTIEATGKNTYVAQGNLTIRGTTVPVTLPFTLAITGKQATMQGQTSLKRLAFGIGKASDAKGEWVSLDIPLTIKVSARSK